MKVYHNQKRGYNNQCIILSFADGDTVNIAVRCNCHMTWHKVTVRIAGIDSWEVNSKEGEKAKSARHLLEETFKWKRGELYCRTSNCDSYGRIVGDIRINNELLSNSIVTMNLAWYRDDSRKQASLTKTT